MFKRIQHRLECRDVMDMLMCGICGEMEEMKEMEELFTSMKEAHQEFTDNRRALRVAMKK